MPAWGQRLGGATALEWRTSGRTAAQYLGTNAHRLGTTLAGPGRWQAETGLQQYFCHNGLTAQAVQRPLDMAAVVWGGEP